MSSHHYTKGSGNVFADMGMAHPEERLLKARLASMINQIIETRGWKQREAGEVLGLTQPKVSDLKRGRLRNFSVEKLFDILTKLDREVTVTVRRRNPDNRGSDEVTIPVM